MFRCALATVAALALAAPASAVPITYTETVFASGSLGTTGFLNETVTLTATADTADITNPSSSIFLVPNATLTVTVSNVGSGTFTNLSNTVVNQGNSSAGYGDPGQDLAILFTFNSAFATYDLATSIGPFSGTPSFNPGATFATSAGVFSITSTSGNATFQAVLGNAPPPNPVPEPATLGVFGVLALGGVLGYRRRRAA